jgi:predicted DNA-binding transcriptional regulator AlpA
MPEQLKDPLQLLTCEEVCTLLSVSMHCLRAWRKRGHGPPFIKASGCQVRYLRADLEEWITKHRVSVSDAD